MREGVVFSFSGSLLAKLNSRCSNFPQAFIVYNYPLGTTLAVPLTETEMEFFKTVNIVQLLSLTCRLPTSKTSKQNCQSTIQKESTALSKDGLRFVQATYINGLA